MKPIFKILLCLWVVLSLNTFFPIFLLAQKPPHLDSLIFLPDNEPFPIEPNPTPEFSPEYRYPDFGFEINPSSSEYRSREAVWRNAPIIVEGRTMKGMLQEERNKYPALFLSDKEVYEVYPYALSYVYRGDVIGDTIYILLPRYNFNKVQAPDPNGHDCKAFVYAPNLYSIAFLKPIKINGFTYYTPCNTNYEGFEWVNELAKFIEDRCIVKGYSKSDILQTFSEKGDHLQVKRSIAEEKKQKEVEREKHISPKKSDAIPVTGQKIEEYMGDRHACRYYDPRRAHKVMFDGALHPFIETRADGTIYNYQDGERYNNCEYHAYGIFFDLTDQPSVENTELFDNIGGFTFQQLYFLLGFQDRSLCQYVGNRIAPVCIQNGTFNQLLQMVDHRTLDDGSNVGHFLTCWQ